MADEATAALHAHIRTLHRNQDTLKRELEEEIRKRKKLEQEMASFMANTNIAIVKLQNEGKKKNSKVGYDMC